MAKVGISLKIDVSKIEKARLFKGAKGVYLDATVFVDLGEADQYGNHGMITQDVSKAEKDQGVKGAILGNCKVFWQDGQQQPQQGFAQPQQPAQGFAQPQQGFGSHAPQQRPQAQPAQDFDSFDDIGF
jgi:hypothetical protein